MKSLIKDSSFLSENNTINRVGDDSKIRRAKL